MQERHVKTFKEALKEFLEAPTPTNIVVYAERFGYLAAPSATGSSLYLNRSPTYAQVQLAWRGPFSHLPQDVLVVDPNPSIRDYEPISAECQHLLLEALQQDYFKCTRGKFRVVQNYATVGRTAAGKPVYQSMGTTSETQDMIYVPKTFSCVNCPYVMTCSTNGWPVNDPEGALNAES